MNLKVGDVIEFPEHAKGGGWIESGARYVAPNGVPGQFRVKAIRPDGTIDLELVKSDLKPPVR